MEVERLRRLKRLQRDERLSLAEVRERLKAGERLPSTKTLMGRFLRAALDGRMATARRVVLEAVEAGLPLERVQEEVLKPALYEVGERWEAGRLAVSQEHEVSALVRDILGELAARVPDAESPRTLAVAACAPGELHDLGLRMLTTELRRDGWAVHFLGANVPPEALAQAVRARQPQLVLLSITRREHADALGQAIRAAREAAGGRRTRILVGGQGARGLEESVTEWGAEVAREGERP
jgi:methanogenic corrinoid protein MtbC1